MYESAKTLKNNILRVLNTQNVKNDVYIHFNLRSEPNIILTN